MVGQDSRVHGAGGAEKKLAVAHHKRVCGVILGMMGTSRGARWRPFSFAARSAAGTSPTARGPPFPSREKKNPVRGPPHSEAVISAAVLPFLYMISVPSAGIGSRLARGY